MRDTLGRDLGDFALTILDRETRIGRGKVRDFYLKVTFDETLATGPQRCISYLHVRAPTYEKAVDMACEHIGNSCLDAKLRDEIIGWSIYKNAVVTTPVDERKRCRYICHGTLRPQC